MQYRNLWHIYFARSLKINITKITISLHRNSNFLSQPELIKFYFKVSTDQREKICDKIRTEHANRSLACLLAVWVARFNPDQFLIILDLFGTLIARAGVSFFDQISSWSTLSKRISCGFKEEIFYRKVKFSPDINLWLIFLTIF